MSEQEVPQPEAGYQAVPAQLDLPAMDHEIIKLWDAKNTFRRSWEATKDGEPWTFFEGPPTANGHPGTHHIEARVFKDIFPRFKTMQGRRVDRKAGWDCHGLPVELAVENELGIDDKSEIEEYGVAKFNALCRKSVSRYVGEFATLTNRMGYWVNLDDAYWTMDPHYVESEWWALKQIFDKGLLVEDYRVTPYCPKDETALSDHEVSQGYQDVSDPSVYVRFPLLSGPWAGTNLLVWTTTPWTLVSNTAVAVHPKVTYVRAVAGDDSLVVAEPLFDSVLGSISDEDGNQVWKVTEKITGAQMERWDYQRPFELVQFKDKANYVILADYVTTGDGTGLVHEAPAFGADDMASCRAYGLEMVNPVRSDGTFDADVPLIGGQFFKSADKPLVADLEKRGLLWKLQPYTHSYPHCWRCGTPLIYYAQPSWYIRTTQIKDALLRENEATNWYPDTIKHGRYGDWLTNNIDWALSRSRYWGTPLPIWRNELDPSKIVCVGSRAELGELAGQDLTELDPHRPFVDDITFTLPGVEGVYRRVPEVIDAWFDSGSMPFAQWGYPYVEGSKEKFEQHYPADFICEAIDQTRGWFYTLMAVGTLVFDQSSYRNVLCLGHILAEDGRKMSKHLGNILEPIPLLDEHGADAVRWFMACAGSPWSARRVGAGALQETTRKVLLTYWNTVAFHSLYARANKWTPSGQAPAIADRHVLDRWLTSATQQLIVDVTSDLENFDTQHAGVLLADFVDNLSNWYVRRSRRRFWAGDPNALWTLHETLNQLTRLLAPIVPFITERVWQDLFVPTDPQLPDSVHLTSWPVADTSLINEQLDDAMKLARRLVELGRAARAEAKVKTRQPLRRALISSNARSHLLDALLGEITSELNIGSVETFSDAGDVVDYSAKANFRALGKRFGKQTPVVAKAVASADAAELANTLADGGTVKLDVSGVGEVELGAGDIFITERPREGWSVVDEDGQTIALDLELTPELVADGMAREAIRFIQETRKASGLDVSDRIKLQWAADNPDTAKAVASHLKQIADEVLAVATAEAPAAEGWADDAETGLHVRVEKA
ncbi:isoleucine--tRNA ligase [Propionimicrobium sp. PCR01-08-3]|uniref:isoleucine--tRNA ligase n=1 Tax=Propionimicrobium sp. PCR01-08-3 TaxID=3052086 RepID=UPI00255C8E48|nr:isoleucine--tRNA ligase [Propionimicrobium sp. PCR01-08-3]WIY82178.1 isoleucine--tRNA ligase [Propionimicrobium sp. PCR01-08-3]